MDAVEQSLARMLTVTRGLNRRFPEGNHPFQIMTRLLEEAGELAAEVNHFEGSVTKRAKHGEPDTARLAKEVQDVMRSALQVAEYYGISDALAESIDRSYQQLRAEGLVLG